MSEEPRRLYWNDLMEAIGATCVLIDGERVQPLGVGHMRVASKSVPGDWHTVERNDESGLWECTCKGFQVRRRCRHARAMMHAEAVEADVRFARDDEGGNA